MRQVQLHEIIACQSQNSDVVGAVFQRLHPSLVSLSYRYLGNSEDAQDVVMVSWMKVLERLSSFQYQHPLSFYAWIKKICVNECLGILRLRNNFNLQSLQGFCCDGWRICPRAIALYSICSRWKGFPMPRLPRCLKFQSLPVNHNIAKRGYAC